MLSSQKSQKYGTNKFFHDFLKNLRKKEMSLLNTVAYTRGDRLPLYTDMKKLHLAPHQGVFQILKKMTIFWQKIDNFPSIF